MTTPNLADIKARLAKLGVSVHPEAELTTYAQPTGSVPLIVLDRVADVPHPDYCINGFATCVACHEFVYLGDESLAAVQHQGIYPICLPCARIHIPQDMKPAGRVHDRERHGRD